MKIMHGYAFFIFILSICGASKTYICVVNEIYHNDGHT